MSCIIFDNKCIFTTFVILALALTVLSYAKTGVSSQSPSTPEIWLTFFDETDSFENTLAETEFRLLPQFDNELISKFNQTDYIIQNDIRSVLFTCQANYPVVWTVPHLKQVENLPYNLFETSSSRMSDFDPEENPMPRNKVFQTFLNLDLDFVEDVFSVNFTCGKANTENQQLPSSIHLYFMGKNAIEYQGRTIEVFVDPSKEKDTSSTFILPCRPATPNVPILLEKQINKIKWKRFKYPSKYVKFDPKVGFIMDKNPMGKRSMIFGLYRCTALTEQEDNNLESDDEGRRENGHHQQQLVYINVTSSSGKIDIEDIQFQSNLELHGESMMMYSHKIFSSPLNSESVNLSLKSYEDDDFLCCSGVNNYLPKIYAKSCTSHLECEILKMDVAVKLQWNASTEANHSEDSIYKARECRTSHYGSPIPSDCCESDFRGSTIILCNGINVDFAEHLVNVFSEHLFPVGQRLQGGDKILSIFRPEGNSYDNSNYDGDLSSKIFLTIGYPITSKQLDEDNGTYYDREHGLEFGETVTFSEADYEEESLETLERRREALSKKIAEYPRDHFYAGEILVPFCLGWKNFYSGGAYMGVSFKNGTKNIINLGNEPSTTVVYLAGGVYSNNNRYWLTLNHNFGKKIVAHEDMVSVDCWMPQWNTEGWDRITRNFTVLEGIPPKFQNGGGGEEILYFYLGEERKVLEWIVVDGVPESRIHVTKDGREIVKGLSSKVESYDEENEVENPFEMLFNVTLERGNRVAGEVSNDTVTVVMISFLEKITLEIQGTYECTAGNVGGKVRQSFRVIVAEKRNMYLPILLGITIVLLLTVGAGIAYRHSLKTSWLRNKLY